MSRGFGSKREACQGMVAGRAGGFVVGCSLCEEPVSLAVRPGKWCRGLAASSERSSVLSLRLMAAGSLAGDCALISYTL